VNLLIKTDTVPSPWWEEVRCRLAMTVQKRR
jgi:hypothetical protein